MLPSISAPGVSTEEINRWVHDYCIEHGAIPADLNYEGFPKSVCTSINEVVCHGIPSEDDVLASGDIVNVDMSTILDGYFSDSSRMFCIGEVDEEKRRLVEVTREAVEAGLAAVKPWAHLGDVSAAVNKVATDAGFSVVVEFGGHGIGLEFHEDPFVSFVAAGGDGPRARSWTCASRSSPWSTWVQAKIDMNDPERLDRAHGRLARRRRSGRCRSSSPRMAMDCCAGSPVISSEGVPPLSFRASGAESRNLDLAFHRVVAGFSLRRLTAAPVEMTTRTACTAPVEMTRHFPQAKGTPRVPFFMLCCRVLCADGGDQEEAGDHGDRGDVASGRGEDDLLEAALLGRDGGADTEPAWRSCSRAFSGLSIIDPILVSQAARCRRISHFLR